MSKYKNSIRLLNLNFFSKFCKIKSHVQLLNPRSRYNASQFSDSLATNKFHGKNVLPADEEILEAREEGSVFSANGTQTPANRTNWQTVGDVQPCEAITDFA